MMPQEANLRSRRAKKRPYYESTSLSETFALEPENGGTLCSKVKKIKCNSDCCTDEVTAFGGSSVMVWGGM